MRQPPYPDQFGQPPNQPPQFGYGPPQPWQQHVPYGPAVPAKGFGFAVVALILGAAAAVVPLLPNLPNALTDYRQYLVYVIALPGLALGILACTGPRKGKPLAIIGAILSILALAVWTAAKLLGIPT